ncbi:hypothetical protein HOLleu_42971 [Holothuria leucospilota]|uniref:AAA+ ATPase domain-containing protein n=1 Tax=Holothuria leucospilota TaxID=206669 RepID=A0A9Q0YEC8_HOLLE|nr:hypothetical protein HOLleu_42971 [Holothuria leucospilota]
MNPKLAHPFTCVIAGPTGCGKTQFVKKMLTQDVIEGAPERIVYCYGEYQPAFVEMSAALPQIRFVEGLPTNLDEYLDPSYKTLIILDDIMTSHVQLYNDTLQRYLTEDKKMTGQPIGLNISTSSDNKGDKSSDNNTSTITTTTTNSNEGEALKADQILTNFPKSLKNKAKLMLNRITDHRQSGKSPIIDWNGNGELLYKGDTVKGSNLTDLILDVMHTRKDFNPVGCQKFIHGLSELNFPEAHVGNLARRQVMHQIRETGLHGDISKLLPTPPRDVRSKTGAIAKSKRRKIPNFDKVLCTCHKNWNYIKGTSKI